jgi:2-polyprenyl-3-methyl-5-hydroxy-6-metoxy-1,4-benzoquinol methylase
MGELKTQLDQLLSGYLKTVAVCTGVELGIFDAVAHRPLSANETANLLDLDLRATDILLNALCALGLLHKNGDLFSLTDLSSTYFAAGSARYAGNAAMLVSQMHERSHSLPVVVRTGRPQAVTPRHDFQTRLRTAVMAMAELSAEFAGNLADAVDLSSVKTVLDLGCGPAVATFEMIRRNRNIKAVLIDRPAVLEITRELIDDHGLQNNVTARAVDLFAGDIGSGYDVVLISNVIHEYSPDENLTLVRKASQALNPGGHLLISDLVLDPGRTSPELPALFALEMLINTPLGRTYTCEEILAWMDGASLTEMRVIPGGTSVLIGKKSS